MGFYSFYKIIKDIFSTIFGRKTFRIILIIALLLLVFSFLCNKGVFAATGTVSTELTDVEVSNYIRQNYISNQNLFVLKSMSYYTSNPSSEFWQDLYSTFWEQGDFVNFYIDRTSANTDLFYIYDFDGISVSSNVSQMPYTINGTLYNVNYFSTQNKSTYYTVNFSNGEIKKSTVSSNKQIPSAVLTGPTLGTGEYLYFQPPFLVADSVLQFYSYLHGSSSSGSTDYTNLLNSINSSIQTLNTNSSDLLTAVNSMSEILSNIYDKLQNSADYSQQLDNIASNTEQQIQATNDLKDSIMSEDYDSSEADTSLSGASSSADNVDDSSYTGFFTSVFNKLSAVADYNIEDVETITFPINLFNSEGSFSLTSDIIYNIVKDSALYSIVQIIYYYIFGYYIFKFSCNIINKIKDGSFLNGFSSKDEAITSSMM